MLNLELIKSALESAKGLIGDESQSVCDKWLLEEYNTVYAEIELALEEFEKE